MKFSVTGLRAGVSIFKSIEAIKATSLNSDISLCGTSFSLDFPISFKMTSNSTTLSPNHLKTLSPALKSIEANLDILIIQAERDGILQELVEYLALHPKLTLAFASTLTAASTSISSTAKTSTLSNMDIDTFSLPGAAAHVQDKPPSLSKENSVVQEPKMRLQRSTVQPTLPHELLLKIADYIDDGKDFINWIQALTDGKYPSVGDLSLILELQEITGLESENMWPSLNLDATQSMENIRFMSRLSHYFKRIDFGSFCGRWPPEQIILAVPSPKPYVSATIAIPLTKVSLAALVKSKIAKISICRGDAKEEDYESFCGCLQYVIGLKEVDLYDVPSVLLDFLYKSLPDCELESLVVAGHFRRDLRLGNLANVLLLTKLKKLDLSGFNLTLREMQALSQSISQSQLLTLTLGDPRVISEMDVEQIIQCLTDCLIESSVETVKLEGWYLDRERGQYLMDNLPRIRRLKTMKLYNSIPFADSPFFFECVVGTTANIEVLGFQDVEFSAADDDDEEKEDDDPLNLRDLATRYKQYYNTYTKLERKIFSKIFKHDP